MKQELTITQVYEDKDKLSKFVLIYSIKRLLERSILSIKLDKLDFDIPLNAYGQKVFNHLLKLKKYQYCSTSLIKFSLFFELYYRELFIDLDKIDINYIEKFIDGKIKNGEVLIPWIYDRLLYDKYFEEFEDQDETLDYEDTLKLLKGTPQGVFQINNYVLGPFGLIKSPINRFFLPKLEFKLWHCSNPSCEAFHSVELENDVYNELQSISDSINDYCKTHQIDPYGRLYEYLADRPENYFNDKSVDNIMEFVFNCFVEEELKILLKSLLDNTNIRDYLPTKSIFKDNSDSIIKKLNKAQCAQLILISSDEKIIEQLEKLIYTKDIFIPPTEIRNYLNLRFKGFYSTYPECNKLGIRIVSAHSELAIVRLKFLLKDIYSEPGLASLLEWKLKGYSDKYSLDEKLENYIMQEDPKKIIRETVMSGPIQLNKTFETLGGYFIIPSTQDQEDDIVDKILWKLGFDINIYPNTLTKFYEYLRKFADNINRAISYNENDKDDIRSVAVNLFVSLEEVLQITLSYITWILLSDHYTETKFQFVYEDAREFMANQLHNYEYTNGEFLQMDKNGKNTLFPLIEGFNSLIAICDTLIDERINYQKPKSELPHYYGDDKLKQFPFLSKKLVIDLRPIDYQNIKSILLSISTEFGKANVLQIRNRLQHNRDSFPSQGELLTVTDCIGNIISKLDNMNIFPNVFLFKERNIDKYKRSKVIFENYKGSQLTVIPTPEFDSIYLPDLNTPQLILPTIKLGLTSQFLRIEYKDKSRYQQFWKGYPRKKTSNSNIKITDEKIEKIKTDIVQPKTIQIS